MNDQVDPGQQDADAQVIEQEVPHIAEAQPEATDNPEQKEKADANKNAPPRWLQRRLDKATAEKYAAIAEANMLKQRLAEVSTGEPARVDPKEAAKRELEAELKQKEFDKRANQVHAIGVSKFKESFTPALQQLATALDSDYSRLLEVVVDEDPDESAAVLVHLGNNPDEAYELLNKSPREQAKYLARLGIKLSQQPAVKANSAPRPVSPVSGGGRPSQPSPYTAKSMAEYIAARRAS